MRNFEIRVGNKQFIVKAQDKIDAVKKLKDAQKFDKWSNQVKDYDPVAVNAVKEKIKELEAKIKRIEVGGVETAESRALKKKLKEYYENLEIAMKQEPIKYDSVIKDDAKSEIIDQIRWCEYVLANPNSRQAMDAKANYGSSWKTYVKGDLKRYKEQLSKITDSVIKDSIINPRHYAEYGWKIENDLARQCYWEAVAQLAGKFKTEQDYVREIPKLAKQLYEKYVKDIKNEIEKLISAGRSDIQYFEKWAQEQAKNIVAKQGK